ncbi:cytochrome P450 [Nonomuraea sp. SMC257]|uniref:Cytochrome P450 n=1 Tax=Nonomuraea montanisoli TaxID=2741721 RepID=A0A7Y6I4K8_9ACTN|nr:cytochrome P450 [Nonomuraea montanisoli]NUW31612.1 cytochrome P450 [Nonomuraea montanisoli]
MDTARPPGPRGHWLLGNVAAYEKDRVGFLRRHHRDYGDVFSFDERIVFTVDPRLAHQVLTATNRDYVTEPAPFAGTSAPDDAGEAARPWMGARRALRPALADAAPMVVGMDGRFVALLDDALDRTAGREVEVLPLMLDVAGRAVAELCLGEDAAGVPGLLAAVHAALLPFEDAGYQLPGWIPLPRNRRFFRVHRRTSETLTGLVRARRAGAAGTPPRDLLDVLLAARPAMSDASVTSALWTVLIGGHGVPAAALTSVVRELAIRPDLAAALAAEAGPWDGDGRPGDAAPWGGDERPHEGGLPGVGGAHGRNGPRGVGGAHGQDGPPGPEGIPAGGGCPRARLPLAEAVVREVLRLCPPAWTMTRVACAAVDFGGWRLRPGEEVLSIPYLIHRDPRWWPDPDVFDPSRWPAARPSPGTYLPFGSGPRRCLGAAAAMRQLTLATSRIAQRFHVRAPDAAAAVPAFCGRLAPAGLRAAFHPVEP